jgi:catechol 2,3-dioxygenase-like lactoylglutathione lyase family enzyme|tara:strand:- start:479 stop:835 length:357 start_codon:yes stop_codon:yes gene_type:complete
MQFAGVHHVSLNVTNAAESTRFYVAVVGMTLRDDRPDFPFDGAWLQAGEQQVHLLEVAGFVPPKGQHFALGVADLDAAKADLESKGVKVSDPSQVGDICRQSFFHDPTGNLIEINQPL